MMFIWAVTLKDKTVIWQYDQSGREVRYGDIDLSKAEYIGWYPVPKGAHPYYEIKLEEGDVPVLLRRHQVSVNTEKDDLMYYLLGIKGKFVMFIDQTGNVEVKYGADVL